MSIPWLSLLLWTPIGAAGLCLILPRKATYWAKTLTFSVLISALVLITYLLYSVHTTSLSGLYELENFIGVEKHLWFAFHVGEARIAVYYLLGADALSVYLLLLSVILFLVGLIWDIHISHAPRYYGLYLLLFGAITGALSSLDLLLFFLFLEFLALPAYALILYPGKEKQAHAALYFLLYSFLGSVLVFVVILGIYIGRAEDLTEPLRAYTLAQRPHEKVFALSTYHFLGLSLRSWAFFAVCLGLSIKLPIVPLHSWLPKAHVEAPTSISILLAGILLKLSAYALLRLLGVFFPDMLAIHGHWLIGFGLFSMIYGSLNALASQDAKVLIAYSSVAHMGMVLFGIGCGTIYGLLGAMYQLMSHGLLSAALFLCIGILERKGNVRDIGAFSGLSKKMPRLAALSGVFLFANFGLPGFSGFIAEWFLLMSALEAVAVNIVSWSILILLVIGILLGIGYNTWTFQRLFQGDYWVKVPRFSPSDLRLSETLLLTFLLLFSLFLGLYPQPLLHAFESVLHPLFHTLHTQ